LRNKAKHIKFVLTDNDGVLTDTGVYYSIRGEELKRYSVRDGMGVERLRKISKIDTGIITKERSGLIKKRAKKLKIKETYCGVNNKVHVFDNILEKHELKKENIAYIGDDVNDIELIEMAGLTAAPADAMKNIKTMVDYVCENKGGNGAFREFAELIIELKNEIK
jgi:YrbI family 3-deoxy-D-manno-octulosonate 8-phosphate phosphatase